MLDMDGNIIGISFDQAQNDERQVNGLRISGVAAISVGIAAAVAGLSWWWFEW
jgi:hypothetical protein